MLVLVYALSISWFSWNHYDVGKIRSVENDFFAWYVTNAEKIVEGNFSDLNYRFNPIGYPTVLAMVEWAVEDFFVAGKIISVVSSVLTLFCIYFLIREAFNPLLAILVLAATAANKYFIESSYYIGTDMMFMAIACLTMSTLISRRPGNVLMAGLFTGMAYLTRYNGIFLIPVALGYLFFQKPVKNFWKRLQPCAVFLSSFALSILPWSLFLYIKKGSFLYNENYLNMAFDFMPRHVAKDHWSLFYGDKYQSFGDVFFAGPGTFLWNVILNVGGHAERIFNDFVPEYLGVFFILGILFLLIGLVKPENNRGVRAGLLLSYLMYLLLMGLIHFESRYLLYLVPFVSLAYVYGLYQILNKFSLLAELPRLAVLAGVIFATAWGAVSFHSGYIKTFNTEVLKFGDFMKFVSNPTQEIMSRSAVIAYFSRTRWAYLSLAENPSEMAKFARKYESDFVFYTMVESAMRPELKKLVTSGPWPGLQKIMEWRPSSRRAVIYRVLPDPTTTGLMEASRDNFATEELWQEFLLIASHSTKKPIRLEGLLIAKDSGQHTLVFSADEFSLSIDGKTVMKDRRERSSFVEKTLTLEKGFHLIQIEFSANRKLVVPLGLYWETAEDARGPIPRTSFVINQVSQVSRGRS